MQIESQSASAHSKANPQIWIPQYCKFSFEDNAKGSLLSTETGVVPEHC